MRELFEVAAGSIIGRDHRLVGKNNQDAYHWVATDEVVLAVVCDGCGSGAHSEVGAQCTTRFLVQSLLRHLQGRATPPWPLIQQDLVQHLRQVAEHLGPALAPVVHEYLLCTVVGALLTPTLTTLFSFGDGVMALNDSLMCLGPFPDNAPPYLAYALLQAQPDAMPPGCGHFTIQRTLPTAAVQSLLIGSDGLTAFIHAAERTMPGQQTTVGPLRQFWQESRYFQNPDMVRRKLSLLNREVVQPDWQAGRLHRQAGLLPDDTTLVVMRRIAGR